MAANACVRPLTSDAAPTNARGSARYMYVGRGNLVSTARGTMRLVARLGKSRHKTRKVEGGSGGLRGPREGFRAVFRAQQWRVCTTPNQRRDRALGRILGGLRGLATGATRVGWWWGGPPPPSKFRWALRKSGERRQLTAQRVAQPQSNPGRPREGAGAGSGPY